MYIEANRSNYQVAKMAQWLKVSIANREGDIYQDVVLKDVMIAGQLDMSGEYDYSADDVVELTVKFRSDWWDERVA